MDTIENASEVPKGLWVISSKVRGLSEVFHSISSDELISEAGACGLSYLLRSIADEVDHLKGVLEFDLEKETIV